MARDFDTARTVLKYYRERPGQDIHYKDATEGVGLSPDKAGSVCSALNRAVDRHPEMGIKWIARGTYRYVPTELREIEKATVPDMVEIVGFMEDKSTMIVRDESGSLSLWRRVEIPS